MLSFAVGGGDAVALEARSSLPGELPRAMSERPAADGTRRKSRTVRQQAVPECATDSSATPRPGPAPAIFGCCTASRRRHDTCWHLSMFETCVRAGFQWRAQPDCWRWVILGALGLAPVSCGGRSNDAAPDTSGVALPVNGGSAGRGATPARAAGGGGAGPEGSGTAGSGTAGTTSGSAGFGGTGSGGSGLNTTPSACEPPLTDLGGGWEQCGSGMLHRTTLGTCASSVPRPDPATQPYPDPAPVDAGLPGACRYDSDCTQGPYGHCEWEPYLQGTACSYGCVTNSDCDLGYACTCGDPVGTCRPATCTVDAECGAGFLCSDFIANPGCGGQVFGCQRAKDACAAQSDCPEGYYCVRGDYPTLTSEAPSYCAPPQCVIGRPFLVAGDERLASPLARSDWYTANGVGPVAPSPSSESAASRELREAIGAGWLEQALMEHASVAAFARFSLQLLALGAPAELCSQAAQAMGDEIEHARACFLLARRHSDSDVGPGPLDMTNALEATELETIMLGTIAEGCIGETVAAIEAAEALEHCRDDAARAVLARIAEDETRHAELAWRFVAWALEVGPASLRERARAAFAEAAPDRAASASPTSRDLQLAEHGLIAPSLRAELRRRVLHDVIAPCAHALIDGRQASSSNTRYLESGVAPG